MTLDQELLQGLLRSQPMEIRFPGLKEGSLAALLHSAAYQALEEITRTVRDETLDDPQCFEKIEQIIGILEKHGIDPGFRHDFG